MAVVDQELPVGKVEVADLNHLVAAGMVEA